jgi:hypothetical protein
VGGPATYSNSLKNCCDLVVGSERGIWLSKNVLDRFSIKSWYLLE